MKSRMSQYRGVGRGAEGGFSLVELMIALVLGLVLLAGVASVFVGSKQAFRTQESLGGIQETGRFINYMVVPYVRLAGYLADPLVQVNPVEYFLRPGPDDEEIEDDLSEEYSPDEDLFRALWGVDGDPDAAASATAAAAGVTYAARSDVLVVRYLGQAAPADDAAADGQMRTCLGLPASGDAAAGLRADHMAENVFFISAQENGVSSLSCRARVYTMGAPGSEPTELWSNGPQPLLPNVQDMQILYGEDTDPSDDVPAAGGTPGYFPNIFRRADQVSNWQRVVTVRISVTVDGGDRTEGDMSVGSREEDEEDDYVAEENLVEDGRLRRTFTTTLNIRNRLRS